MKQRSGLYLAIAAMAVLASMPLAAQKKAEKQQPMTQAQEDEMMKQWQAAMTPGASHKVLEGMAGEWNSETKVWMAGPEAPPAVSKGFSSMKMMLGGRFLQHDMAGEMMGMPMKGFGLTGYDNVKKKYVGIWVDNMSTAIYTLEGTANADNTVLTFAGFVTDPATGQMSKPVKWITRILGKDKHTFEMHHAEAEGQEMKVMEVVYDRKK